MKLNDVKNLRETARKANFQLGQMKGAVLSNETSAKAAFGALN